MLKLVSYKKENIVKTTLNDYQGLAPLQDHRTLLNRYFDSYRMKNYSPKTITRERDFLDKWFELHGMLERPMYSWEAMIPVTGRDRILNYSNALLDSELTIKTVRAYLGILSRFFSYILEYPYFIDNGVTQRVQDRYHDIVQPVCESDFPKHVYNGEQLGIPLDPEKLYDFYTIIRNTYLPKARYSLVAYRSYTMIVLAGESGLRIDEIINIEPQDLFFESKKIQTRFAKGTKGSGKRARTTLLTPLAHDTLKFYLSIRKKIIKEAKESPYLFPSKTGNKLDYSPVHLALKKMVKHSQKEGLPILDHFSWHWMRRIFATRFIERFPHQLSVLVSLLGHVTPNTVHCYIKHSEAWMDEKIKEVLHKGFK